MKRLLCLIFLLCFLFTGCATVSIVGPAGQKTTLLSEPDPTTFRTTKKVWYVLWGLVPITDNSTAEIIAHYNLKDVKVRTQYDIIDWLISAVLGGLSLHTKTVIIEGNTGK